MSVVLIDKDIIYSVCVVSRLALRRVAVAMRVELTALILAGRQGGRRKSETLHLCRLGQQWPSGRLWHTVGLYKCAAGVDACDRGVVGSALSGRGLGGGQPIAGHV